MPYKPRLRLDLPCLLLSAIAALSLFKLGQKRGIRQSLTITSKSTLIELPKLSYRSVYSTVLLLVITLLGCSVANADNNGPKTITISSSIKWSQITTGSGTNGQPAVGDTVIVASFATLTVDVTNGVCASIQLGQLQYNGGNFIAGPGKLTFNAGSKVTVSGAVTLGVIVSGYSSSLLSGSIDMTNGGTLSVNTLVATNLGTWQSGTGTVIINAVSTLDADIPTYYNLTINSPSGTVTMAGNVKVNGRLNLGKYTVTTGSNTLVVANTDCSNSRISRTSGYVIGNLNLAYPVRSSTTTCKYYVGDSTGYAPITIVMSNVTVAGTVTGKVFAGDHPDTTSSVSGIDVAKSANHYWTLVAGTTSPTYSSYSATLQFCANTNSCTTNEVDSSATASSFVVAEKVSGIWSMLTVGTKLTYSTQATGIRQFGEFSVGQSRTNALLHHIQIIQGGSACTSSPVTITVKACADAACTTLYNSSVTASLTASNTGVLSSSNITFSGGQATVTLTDTTPSTDVLGGSATSATNQTATCTNSAGGTSCSITVADCSFDVVEVGANASTPIYTKLAQTAFNLDVLSLSSNPQTLTTPFIELVDMNTGIGTCATALALSSSSVTITPTLSGIASFSANQRKTLTFTYNNAAPNVRVRVTSSSAVSCSLDNFAVRPGALTMTTSANAASPSVSATPKIKAGNNFTISAATSTSATDTYTGILLVDTSKLTVQETGVLGSLTSFKPDSTELTPTAVLANSTTTMSYSDVGYVYASAGAFRDDSFTSIDQPNDCISSTVADANLAVSLSGNKYGCSIGNQSAITFGRFIPDHFTVVADVSNECPSGGFTYMGQLFSPFTDSSLVEARNSSDSVTKNYQPPYAPGTIALGAENADNGINLATRISSFPGTWNSGLYSLTDTTGTFSLPLTTTADSTWGSFDSLDIGLTVVDSDVTTLPIVNSADMNPTIAGGSTFTYKKFTGSPLTMRYGSIALQNASGSELLDLAMPMTAQYWNGTAWVTNTADSCTTGITLTKSTPNPNPNPVTSQISSVLCAYDTGVSSGLSGIGCANAGTTNKFSNAVLGNFNLNLKAPGSGNTGTMGITATVPSYLQYNWTGSGNSNPTANVTFGIYTGNPNFIYLRELY